MVIIMRKLSAFAVVLALAGCVTASPTRDVAIQAALEILTPIVRERIRVRCEGKPDSRACIAAEIALAARQERRR